LPGGVAPPTVGYAAFRGRSAAGFPSTLTHKNTDTPDGMDFEGDGMTLFIFYIMMAATFYLSLILDALAVIVQSILSRIRS
jgi:hypothetical protein